MAPRCFLAFFILTSSLVVGQSPKYALKGGKVSLKPGIAELPDGILWKLDGNKVVEFNGNEEQVYSPFDNRITLGWVSAELQITDLRFEDSGAYELEVEVKKALHHRSVHKLEVIDTVAEPTISCKMNDGSSSNSSAQLECSSESRRPQPLTKFEWSTRGNVQPGPKLRISLGDERDDEVYSCSVSNPLSSKKATFTAKDCYPDKSSSVALIASLLSIFVLLLVGVGVGIWFCKQHHKACFAKRDLEKQPPPDTTEGSDKAQAQGDVNTPLLDRESTLLSTQQLHQFEQDEKKAKADINRDLLERASIRLSNQPLRQFPLAVDMDKQEEELPKGRSPSTVDMGKQEEELPKGRSPGTCDVVKQDDTPQKGHVDGAKKKLYGEDYAGQTPLKKLQTGLENHTDEHKRTASPPSPPPSESPSPLDLNNPASNDDRDADADQYGESAEEEVPQYDPSDSEKANEPDQAEPEKEAHDEEKPATSETSPAVQPHSPATKSSPNMAPEDTGGEHEEDADSDQVTGGTAEKADSSEKNESDNSSEDELSSTIPEQRGSKTLLHDINFSQEEANTNKDNQQETVKPVSEDDDKDKEPYLYSAASQQPKSPTPTKPDNGNADTRQESPDAANEDPDNREEEEGHKTSRDSDEFDGQSDKGKGETDEGKNDIQCGLKEEKPGNESLSEDEEGNKEDEVVK